MNLGGLFTGLGTTGRRNDFLSNKRTILIILVVLVVIFGFGYGRGLFGGNAGFGGAQGGAGSFGGYTEYRYIDPPNRRRGSRHSRRKKKYDEDDVIAYRARYGYGNPGFEYGGYGINSGYAGPGFAGFAGPGGGFFGNDWWFIIAVIGLLLLLGADTDNSTDTAGAATVGNVCC